MRCFWIRDPPTEKTFHLQCQCNSGLRQLTKLLLTYLAAKLLECLCMDSGQQSTITGGPLPVYNAFKMETDPVQYPLELTSITRTFLLSSIAYRLSYFTEHSFEKLLILFNCIYNIIHFCIAVGQIRLPYFVQRRCVNTFQILYLRH